VIEFVLLAGLGGLVAVDGVAAVQSMASRPLVAGWIAGLLLGDPLLGAEVGLLLELYILVSVPSGGGRYPEGGTAAVVAVAAAAGVASTPAALAFGVATGLGTGWIAAQSQVGMRHWNERGADSVDHHLHVREVNRAQSLGLAVDFLRGAALTGLGVIVVRFVAPIFAPAWPLGDPETTVAVLVGAFVSLGILLRAVAEDRVRAVLFGVGLVAGTLLLGGVT
jgi:mannose/fructose/N-acetylgalactosamine-specific phosphotransferase system component IIC